VRKQALQSPFGSVGIGFPNPIDLLRTRPLDSSLPPSRDRAPGDLADLGEAVLAAVVQVDVHVPSGTIREAEDRVEVPVQVALEPAGVDAAHEVGSRAEWGRHGVDRAGVRE